MLITATLAAYRCSPEPMAWVCSSTHPRARVGCMLHAACVCVRVCVQRVSVMMMALLRTFGLKHLPDDTQMLMQASAGVHEGGRRGEHATGGAAELFGLLKHVGALGQGV